MKDETQTIEGEQPKKTSAFDREALLLTHIMQWVITDLNERYKEHVSDMYLAQHLLMAMRAICYTAKPTNKKHMAHPFERRGEQAYHAGCAAFETILEHGCKAGGNGHHVAQRFAKCIEAFTVSPL